MQKPDIIRLRHMFDASQEAVSFIQVEERASLDADRKTEALPGLIDELEKILPSAKV